MGRHVAVITEAHSTGTWQHEAEILVIRALEECGHTVSAYTNGPSLVDDLLANKPDICLLPSGTHEFKTGSVQALLELCDIPYVGSPSEVCRMLQDGWMLSRELSSEAELEYGFSIPPVYLDESCVTTVCRSPRLLGCILNRLSTDYPVCVSQLRGNPPKSSVASDEAALSDALMRLCEADGVLVSAFIDGVNASVVVYTDSEGADVFPCVVRVSGTESGSEVFAPLPDDVLGNLSEAPFIRSEIERHALDAYRCVGCSDLVVVEVVWDGARVHVTGIDPAPALGNDTCVGVAIRAAGVSLSSLLDAMVERACDIKQR